MTAGSERAVRPEAPPLSPQAPEDLTGLTWRALLLGAGFSVLVNVAAPATLWRYQTAELTRSEITRSFLPMGVMFPFFCCVAVLNPLLKLLRPRFALRPAELMIVFTMGLVGITIPIFLMGFFLAIISSPYYFASAENEWAEYFHPYIEAWLTPTNAHNEVAWFYEGLPAWATIPWGAWLVPLFWWLALIGTFYFMCFCLAVIFRRQWTEHERLTFPLMEVPREMVRESASPRRLPAFMRNKLFWIGFAVPALLLYWNWVHFFIPAFPEISFFTSIVVARGFPDIALWLYFPALSFSYLASLDVLASIWIFRLLVVPQEGIYNRVGFSVGTSGIFLWTVAASAWQSAGAFFFMVGFSVWMARKHLGRVMRKAFGGEPDLDDSGEAMSYRMAVWGLLLGLIFFCAWLSRCGMEAHVIAVFVTALFVIYLGLTRIVAQVGLYYFVPPMIAEPFTMFTMGATNMSSKSLIALGFQYSWHGDVQAVFMPAAANVTKLTERIRRATRAVPLAIFISVVVGFITAIGYILIISYDQGAYNFGSSTYRTGGLASFDDVMSRIKTPLGPDWKRISFFSLGAVEMAVLTFLRYRFTWWPLHPVGLAVASAWPMSGMLLNVFLAWLIKLIVLRAGGIRLYERSKPFFIGMICGYFFGEGGPADHRHYSLSPPPWSRLNLR